MEEITSKQFNCFNFEYLKTAIITENLFTYQHLINLCFIRLRFLSNSISLKTSKITILVKLTFQFEGIC